MDGVRTVVLPVRWGMAPELAIRAARDFQAEMVIMNGVAGPRQPLFVEQGATNHCVPREDADGAWPKVVDRLEARPMTIDRRRAVRAARAAIAEHAHVMQGDVALGDVLLGARIARPRKSNGYVCNHVAFHVSRAHERCGFLHWPSELHGAHVIAARAILERIVRALARA